jgi:3',5'-cyclic AMP phosphodiesterase CpdA
MGLRFVILSDTHFYTNGHGKSVIFWNRPLTDEIEDVIRDMIDRIHEIHPDFVIHCGDLIDRCHPDNHEYARGILQRIHCPVYLAAGNHDSLGEFSKKEISGFYHLPDGQSYYSKRFGEYLFIFLDSCYWLKVDGTILSYRDQNLYESGQIGGMAVPDAEISWLEKELEANKDRKVMIVSHAPLSSKKCYPAVTFPNREHADPAGTDLAGMMDRLLCGLKNSGKVLDVIKRYRNVKMVFSGHWHINDTYLEDGIVFCQTASMREYPFEMRVAEETASGVLSVRTIGLNNESYAKASYCPDRGNRWVRGTQESREFTVDFNG